MLQELLFNNFLKTSQWSLGLILVLVLPRLWNWYHRLSMMPPGPLGFPLLGNVLQVPTSLPWFQFTRWSRKYGKHLLLLVMSSCIFLRQGIGPIFSLNLAGQPVVVLNTFRVASDLLGVYMIYIIAIYAKLTLPFQSADQIYTATVQD